MRCVAEGLMRSGWQVSPLSQVPSRGCLDTRPGEPVAPLLPYSSHQGGVTNSDLSPRSKMLFKVDFGREPQAAVGRLDKLG